MAWGSSREPSTFSKVFPLVVVVLFLAIAGYIGYQIYLSAQQIGNTASERMNKKNVVWTKDGLKVGVKSIQNEKYVDETQSWVVKAWNLGKDGARASGGDKKD
ncbi:uncharacterized protein F5Z01DRAFT_678072 [Emericellopsis atlantica]|uniref:Uncharacterized protein n=1 Tax=Emericellopsis atlantica TaxID=2614577 RepID=A0A9P7ZE79_9HYPO|nr:uncharacterized protein F5Z01DRAFT_678072 [Emericellopsis atlantica]KAG9250162.1 hypothetical protein F5Z01DRAFT_678072 [Emericellopsis atlantica]